MFDASKIKRIDWYFNDLNSYVSALSQLNNRWLVWFKVVQDSTPPSLIIVDYINNMVNNLNDEQMTLNIMNYNSLELFVNEIVSNGHTYQSAIIVMDEFVDDDIMSTIYSLTKNQSTFCKVGDKLKNYKTNPFGLRNGNPLSLNNIF